MPPHNGLTHLKEYDIKDSNVEFIGTEIDHRIKYASAQTEPAWNNGLIGQQAGLYVWRIENFEVIPWPAQKAGQFYEGDSYIVLHSYQVGNPPNEKLGHEIYFWIGAKSSQDERGTAAYKTVELDEFLEGKATQHRETQNAPSEDFLALFPRIRILRGGVDSGFTHVDTDATPPEVTTLLRVFKHGRSMLVVEVEPTWQSLSEEDVFILDKGEKIWVWQGKGCSPTEKAKAAQVVNDMTLAKHVDVEVLAQAESRSAVFVSLLGGYALPSEFRAARPVAERSAANHGKKLLRLSDASGQLSFDTVKSNENIEKSDFNTKDVFLLDVGSSIWVWRGLGASAAEKAMWLKVAQSYIQHNQIKSEVSLASVVEGNESPAFLRAIEV